MQRGKGGLQWRDILCYGLRQTLSSSGLHSFLSWVVEYAATGRKRENRVGSGIGPRTRGACVVQGPGPSPPGLVGLVTAAQDLGPCTGPRCGPVETHVVLGKPPGYYYYTYEQCHSHFYGLCALNQTRVTGDWTRGKGNWKGRHGTCREATDIWREYEFMSYELRRVTSYVGSLLRRAPLRPRYEKLYVLLRFDLRGCPNRIFGGARIASSHDLRHVPHHSHEPTSSTYGPFNGIGGAHRYAKR